MCFLSKIFFGYVKLTTPFSYFSKSQLTETFCLMVILFDTIDLTGPSEVKRDSFVSFSLLFLRPHHYRHLFYFDVGVTGHPSDASLFDSTVSLTRTIAMRYRRTSTTSVVHPPELRSPKWSVTFNQSPKGIHGHCYFKEKVTGVKFDRRNW